MACFRKTIHKSTDTCYTIIGSEREQRGAVALLTVENNKKLFNELYGEGETPNLFFAPGRVNLIGEHIDYNGGLVFPAALELGNYVFARKNDSNMVRLRAVDLPETIVECSLDDLESRRGKAWGSYQLGVIYELLKIYGDKLVGLDMLFFSTLPFGAGLSSSASIELATGIASLYFIEQEMDMTSLALLCQRAENDYVGVMCGIMDQFACAHGQQGHGILLNCETLDFEHIPLNMQGYSIIIANTNKKRELSDSKYNERRAECEKALAFLKQKLPKLNNLCELDSDTLNQHNNLITDVNVGKRAKHVVSENERVKMAAVCIKAGDVKLFGELLKQSHISLRDLYEVTGAELDAMFEAAIHFEHCVGGRMTGAGFGGCTVNLVKEGYENEFIDNVACQYKKKTNISPDFYVVKAGSGPSMLK